MIEDRFQTNVLQILCSRPSSTVIKTGILRMHLCSDQGTIVRAKTEMSKWTIEQEAFHSKLRGEKKRKGRKKKKRGKKKKKLSTSFTSASFNHFLSPRHWYMSHTSEWNGIMKGRNGKERVRNGSTKGRNVISHRS